MARFILETDIINPSRRIIRLVGDNPSVNTGKQTDYPSLDQLRVGLIAQLVEDCNGIAELTSQSNPVQTYCDRLSHIKTFIRSSNAVEPPLTDTSRSRRTLGHVPSTATNKHYIFNLTYADTFSGPEGVSLREVRLYMIFNIFTS